MFEIFKTVFLLSCIGAFLTAVLLIIKPFTVKRLPAGWQVCIWLLVLVCMLVPIWKLIPKKSLQQAAPQFVTEQVLISTPPPQNREAAKREVFVDEEIPVKREEASSNRKINIDFYTAAAVLWIGGAGVFLLLYAASYFTFVIKRRKSSVDLTENEAFEEVKNELKIKRRIRVRIYDGADSPMLVGVIFPVIYVPARPVNKEAEKMIFRHELMHYKHKDLILKWFSLMVNALHWFNPFVYLLSANLGQALEVSCDMAVIKNLDEDERKLYMNTILDLVKRKRR